MNQSMYLGKASEHLIISKLLSEGREIYVPAVDDHGVDLLVRTIQTNSSHTYQEIQVKSISTGGLFAAISCPKPSPNYWYVFYVKDINTLWLINSVDFTNIASKNVKGKNVGKYSLSLANKKGPAKNWSKYIITNFNQLP